MVRLGNVEAEEGPDRPLAPAGARGKPEENGGEEEAESEGGQVQHPLRQHEAHAEEEVRGGEEGDDAQKNTSQHQSSINDFYQI